MVTQPRRICAISVSRRVAQEQAEPLGKSIGYQIRLEKVMPSTPDSILFCTTGVLLRRMQGDTQLEDFTHVVLDEVHERDVKSDFLMMLLRDLIRIRGDIRIVLMSATLNARLFSDYFGGTPMLHVLFFPFSSFISLIFSFLFTHTFLQIPGFTHPVEQIYLEQITHTLGPRMQWRAFPPTPRERGTGEVGFCFLNLKDFYYYYYLILFIFVSFTFLNLSLFFFFFFFFFFFLGS